MGNRACVVFTNKNATDLSPAVYLHWNGGPESIYAFLDEMDRRKCGGTVDYCAARFTHIVGDFFDGDEAGGSSLGVMNGPKAITPEELRPFAGMADDNGVYVISRKDDKWCVRRFILRSYSNNEVYEMNRREVAAERKTAYKHPYLAGNENGDSIAKTFAQMRPKISKYG